MKYFKAEILKSIERIHYLDGCDPKTFQGLGVILTIQAESMSALLGKIKDNIGIDALEVFENRLEGSVLETSDGYAANSSMIERWKMGNVTLFNASYSAYVSEVSEVQLTEQELRKALL